MNLFERIAAEYESIRLTKFWEVYIEKIREKRAVESRACETNKEPERNQGACEALDFVIGRGKDYQPLPERILVELRSKSTGG